MERWVWGCHYDRGSGADREICRAGSRKPVATQQAAERMLQNHIRKSCCFRFSNRGEQSRVWKLSNRERWR